LGKEWLDFAENLLFCALSGDKESKFISSSQRLRVPTGTAKELPVSQLCFISSRKI